jgi:hypothetical protein
VKNARISSDSPPSKGDSYFFYKYSGLSTSEHLERLRVIVQEHEIYLPTLPQLNDPADGRPRLAPLSENEMSSFLADSASAVIGTLQYSGLLTAFSVLGMIFSPLMCLWLGVGGLSAHVGPKNQTVQALACYAAAASAAGSGAMPPRITAAVC